MISPPPHRTAIGMLMLVAGVALFSYWAWYFIHLVRPIDAWDFSLLPLSVASILVGATLGGLRVSASVAGPTLKRDAVRSVAVGAFVAIGLNVRFNAVAGLEYAGTGGGGGTMRRRQQKPRFCPRDPQDRQDSGLAEAARRRHRHTAPY